MVVGLFEATLFEKALDSLAIFRCYDDIEIHLKAVLNAETAYPPTSTYRSSLSSNSLRSLMRALLRLLKLMIGRVRLLGKLR